MYKYIINVITLKIQNFIFFVLWWNSFIPSIDPNGAPIKDKNKRTISGILVKCFFAKNLSRPYIKNVNKLIIIKYLIKSFICKLYSV
jgi:hypothetical protein